MNQNHFEAKFLEITGKDFNAYYKTYHPKLLWNVTNIVRDADDAQDIVDMAFMKALSLLDSYDPKYAFSTWLFTIASKMSLQYLKDNKRFSSLDQETSESGMTMGDRLAEPDDDQPEVAERYRMKADIIMEEIDDLDPRYKRVILMREIDNMSYQDIADELNMNLSTVKNHIRSGRQILMKNTAKVFAHIDENY